MATRESFQSIGARGLDYDLPPMRLWRKSKRLGVWDPAEIDFSPDVPDWRNMTANEQDMLLRLTTMFQAGEEAVTLDLLPLIMCVAREGRLEEEMYLTAFLWEEAKHVEVFSRFLNDVIGRREDLTRYHGPCYRQMFYDELPQAMDRLRHDQSPVAQAQASVTYNLIVEGVLAESGYHGYYAVLRQQSVMPGMQQVIDYLKRDEARHLAYGVYLLSRLVVENGDEVWDAIQVRMNELLPIALGMIEEVFTSYDEIPFGLQPQEFIDYAQTQFMSRLTRIEKARGEPIEALAGIDETV